MSRITIDYGIDLGTTNSSVSVFDKAGPRIIRNNDNWQFTPSAVWVDKNGAIRVGLSAKEKAAAEPESGATEFKRMMGKTYSKTFARLGRTLTPEELSAEVLKSLKSDVMRETGENLDAAVITVPAAFDLPETEATRKAAKLAGISVCPLLQEPIAASLAYGFQRNQDNIFWLVYDLGGGTFDAAVMHIRDGVIQVVNHGGDNDLGGKLIDWDIVEQLFVPSLENFELPDFRRGNRRWIGALAKLKMHAERAKIALSRDGSYEIADEFICVDNSGTPVQLNVSVSRKEVERLIEPLVTRTVNICRRVLNEQKLGSGDISRILLVGGPTVTPYIREVLPDSGFGLGIPIDFSVDPLTVVAQGASIFAAGQKVPTVSTNSRSIGEFSVRLEYEPIGNTIEPLVAGEIFGKANGSLRAYTVRFYNPDARPPWDSGRVPLNDSGKFMVNLRAEPGSKNVFTIDLYDPLGVRVPVKPSELPYTVGMVIMDPPLPHDIGIAMANDTVDVLFQKGTPLPASKRTVHVSAVALRKGDPESKLRIPFIEGNNAGHAHLNRKIGEVMIDAGSLRYDLPPGSEIEIRLQIDASRHISGTALIEVLDREFPIVIDGLVKLGRPLNELKAELVAEQRRLQTIGEVDSASQSTVSAQLDQIAKEDVVGQVSRLLESGDESEAVQCEERLLDLRASIQRIEDALARPKLIAEARQEIESVGEIIGDASEENKRAFALLRPELEAALMGDLDALRRRVDQMSALRFRILDDRPDFWVGYRDYLLERKAEMLDQVQAQQWLSHANRAITNNDLPGLKTACRQLLGLLPQSEQSRGYGGGTFRARSSKP